MNDLRHGDRIVGNPGRRTVLLQEVPTLWEFDARESCSRTNLDTQIPNMSVWYLWRL